MTSDIALEYLYYFINSIIHQTWKYFYNNINIILSLILCLGMMFGLICYIIIFLIFASIIIFSRLSIYLINDVTFLNDVVQCNRKKLFYYIWLRGPWSYKWDNINVNMHVIIISNPLSFNWDTMSYTLYKINDFHR